jgi:hypothetical protein
MMAMAYKIIKIAVYAVLAVIAAGALYIGSFIWDEYRLPSRSPIAANLPREFRLATVEFRKRIHERFPIGSQAADMVRELKSQGFVEVKPGTDWWAGEDNPWSHGATPAGQMTLQMPGLPCRLVWNVVWQTANGEEISAIYAEYHGLCV